MKKHGKILSLVLVLLFALTLLAACAPAESSPSASDSASASESASESTSASASESTSASTEEGDAVAAIKDAGKLIMLTEAGFAPYEYIGEDNEVAGVDVEICKAIAEELGVELEVVQMDFDGIIPAIQTGKGDLGAAGITKDPEREKSVSFSINYVDAAQMIVVRKDETAIAGETSEDLVAALAGKNVGVQMGTTGDIFVSDETEATPVQYKKVADAAMELANGKLDALVIDEMPAQQVVSANDDLMVIDTPLTQEQYAIAIAKDKTDLKAVVDEVVQRLLDEGKIDEWITYHKEASAGK